MHRLLAWLNRMYSKLLGRCKRPASGGYVIDIETGHNLVAVMDPEGTVTYIDLAVACSELAQRSHLGFVNEVLADYGASWGRWGLVPQDQLADCIRAIRETVIPNRLNPRAAHTRVSQGRHVGFLTIYEHIATTYEREGIIDSRDIQRMLVDLDFAPNSHGPALSDLTQLGFLESLGEHYYGWRRDPRRADWPEERARLSMMRDARRAL